jgi:hypothetical protein
VRCLSRTCHVPAGPHAKAAAIREQILPNYPAIAEAHEKDPGFKEAVDLYTAGLTATC